MAETSEFINSWIVLDPILSNFVDCDGDRRLKKGVRFQGKKSQSIIDPPELYG